MQILNGMKQIKPVRAGWRALLLLPAVAFLCGLRQPLNAEPPSSPRRCAFLAITNFSAFSQSTAGQTNETALTSLEITAPIDWDELVVSWNLTPGTHLRAEARALYADRAPRYYTMSFWSDS